MPSPYTQLVIKLLFATAKTCAYPGCQVPLVMEDTQRGIRSIAVQIAHIRSAKVNGPRYDPSYPADKLNSDDNLLLLCNTHHHHPVDHHESEYTVDELLEWKKIQVTDGGGFLVRDDEISGLVATLQEAIDELVQATRVQILVRFVGGRVDRTRQVAYTDLDGLDDLERGAGHLLRPGRLIGVEAQNEGLAGAEVQAAGIDIDYGAGQPGPWRYAFPANDLTQWGLPCRVDGHAARVWFEAEDHIREFVDQRYTARGLAPRRFRPWVELGDGDRLTGDWFARVDLPIWETAVDETQLRARFGESA